MRQFLIAMLVGVFLFAGAFAEDAEIIPDTGLITASTPIPEDATVAVMTVSCAMEAGVR